jgi:prepilin-type N-terminal cleavage/methylation domain-containing protein
MRTANMMRMRRLRRARGGFTLVELLIAIFITAGVLGATLLLLATNMNILNKAVEMQVATALAQYQADLVRAIDFPPVYFDGMREYGDIVFQGLPTVVPPTDYTPSDPYLRSKFATYRSVTGYDVDGIELNLISAGAYDAVMYLDVVTRVERKKGPYPLVTVTTHVVRNSLY